MNTADLDALVAAVQANCHIADARHAGDLTLCTYLLQLREFYRWERALPFGASLPQAAVGEWIAAREALWDAVQDDAWLPLPLPLAGQAVDAFDVAAANAALQPQGLVYGAGLVAAGRPVFVLAELRGVAERGGLAVVEAGRELARGLLTPPAALADGDGTPSVLLRREALARWCWQRYEAYALRPRPGSAMDAVVQGHGLQPDFDAALPGWLDAQTGLALLHETGEHRVGVQLGPDWAAMLLALPSRRAELHARALRDQLADLTVTLPTLLERGDALPLHDWFAAYDGVREQLLPGLVQAYAAWRGGDGGAALRAAGARGREHVAALAAQVLDRHRTQGDAAGAAIEALLTSPSAVCRG
jgi:hypothetical protein